MKPIFDKDADYQPDAFKFSDIKQVNEIIGRYPKGRQKSAIMPLLDLAGRQMAKVGAKLKKPHGAWIPRAALDEIARLVDQPAVKVYEVATFYSMYKLYPVGKYLVQICGTTPCWLCGAADIIKACEGHLDIHMGETTKDGLFTLEEVECLGACVNAPMVQINDDYYEDLTPESMVSILKDLKANKKPLVGSQTGRKGSMAANGLTSLTA